MTLKIFGNGQVPRRVMRDSWLETNLNMATVGDDVIYHR